MGIVTVEGKTFTYQDIKDKGPSVLGQPNSPHAHSLVIAQKWLNNEASFSFQTSGSTGDPKIIHFERKQLEASASTTIQFLGLNTQDHFFVCMNTQFIAGAMLLFRGLITKASITLVTPDMNPLKGIPINHSFTFASFAPTQLYAIFENANDEWQKLNLFATILVGGSAIDIRLETKLKTLSARVFHTYGMTETASHIALKELGKETHFLPLPGITIYKDEFGCIAIKGEVTNNETIHSHDLVTIHDNGEFDVQGRNDEVVISGGIKIQIQKVEQILKTYFGESISNILVVGIKDELLGERLIALLESSREMVFDQNEVKLKLAYSLSKYEIPKDFYWVNSFQYTPTGKIDKYKTLMINKLME